MTDERLCVHGVFNYLNGKLGTSDTTIVILDLHTPQAMLTIFRSVVLLLLFAMCKLLLLF